MPLVPYIECGLFGLQPRMITARDPELLATGEFTWAFEIRNTWPGVVSRGGIVAFADPTGGFDGSTAPRSIYQFNTKYANTQQLVLQMDNGSVVIQDNWPVPTGATPYVAEGVALPAGTGAIPASFCTVEDQLIISDGIRQHSIYSPPGSRIGAAVISTDGSTINIDYTDSMMAGTAESFVGSSSFYLCTDAPARRFDFVVSVANTAASTMTISAVVSGAWASQTFTDTTTTAGKPFAKSGYINLTNGHPANELPVYRFGRVGYWYKIAVTSAFVALNLSKITQSSVTPSGIKNTWDGVMPYVVEARVTAGTRVKGSGANNNGLPSDTGAASGPSGVFQGPDPRRPRPKVSKRYDVYGGGDIILSFINNGILYMSCADPAEAFYFNIIDNENTAQYVISGIEIFDSAGAFTTITYTDKTAGLTKSGEIILNPAHVDNVVLSDLNGSAKYKAYFYKISITGGTDNNLLKMSAQYRPRYYIEDFGTIGLVCGSWKNRAVYVFDQYPSYLYVSRAGDAQCLNGEDFGILKAGDGRSNAVVGMVNFVNELLVFQEETGAQGGCVTLFAGYAPANFEKLVLSSSLGAVNGKCIATVDGVMTATATDERLATICYFLSKHGLCATDGRTVSIISDDVADLFDPASSYHITWTAIARNAMWLAYDSSCNIIKIGLCCDGSDSVNDYLVYDITSRTFSFDSHTQTVISMQEVSTDETGLLTGGLKIVLGGVKTYDVENSVYVSSLSRFNSGTDDLGVAFSPFLKMVVNGQQGEIITVNQMAIAGDFGAVTLSGFRNNDLSTSLFTKSISGSSASFRNRFGLNITSGTIALQLEGTGGDFSISKLGVGAKAWIGA